MIVNCTVDVPFNKKNKNNYRLSFDDNPNECSRLLRLIDETKILEKINISIQNRESVLIHCYSGVQRSCAVVACYLIKYHSMNPEDAIKYIKQRREVAFFGDVHFLEAIRVFYKNQNDLNNKFCINIDKMNRVEQMEAIQSQALELFKRKNADYGDAFAKYGVIGV